MSNLSTLLFAKTHEWVRIEGEEAVIGLTQFAQDALGDITYVDLPAVGSEVTAGKEFGAIESVKAASDLYAPVSGIVVACNEDIASTPELVNQSPFEKGWLLRIKISSKPSDLLDLAAYEALCAAEAH